MTNDAPPNVRFSPLPQPRSRRQVTRVAATDLGAWDAENVASERLTGAAKRPDPMDRRCGRNTAAGTTERRFEDPTPRHTCLMDVMGEGRHSRPERAK